VEKAAPDFGAIPKPVRMRLQKLGIHDLAGLQLHLPLRYVDETRITPIRDLRTGMHALVQGEIVHVEVKYRPRRMLVCTLRDADGQINLRFLHFYPSQVAVLKEGAYIRAAGEVRGGFFGWEMVHPQYRTVSQEEPIQETLTPVYPTTSGLTQAALRKWISWALETGSLEETLPQGIYRKLGLPGYADSLRALHHPAPEADLSALEERTTPVWKRLAFDELLAQQLSMRRHYARRRQLTAPPMQPSKKLVGKLLQRLPFSLTTAQQKVLNEISRDLAQPHPMQRLLQGDVGSGKTIVAALAALQAIENGWQVAMMAPTEILAEQHFSKMQAWLAPLAVCVVWLSGSQSRKERMEAMEVTASGEAQLIIGTHALIQEQIQFARLGLAIVDEQHRFGVQQRLSLRQKGVEETDLARQEPHQLMMSATPIPRTLSMSYYADLDVSAIDELPPGRTPVATRLVSEERREEVLLRVREACRQGSQAYWVCPLIEESESLQLKTAQETFALMQQTFPDLRVGLVHGRMKPAEKQAVMEAFSRNEIQLLVATTVIEVGVDVPNASLMVIEHAERMGLSQLHQLRGRVGRGSAVSHCILLYQNPLSETAKARLKIIYESNDGFEIAQADLALRGPGEFLGVRQSGVPMLKIADLQRDADLLPLARDIADKLLHEQPEAVERHLQRWLGHAEELVKA
jgi:ATP-dependent DNA helicase RecG